MTKRMESQREAVARALYALTANQEKLVRSGLLQPTPWDDLPEGCYAHEYAFMQADAAIAAYTATESSRLPHPDDVKPLPQSIFNLEREKKGEQL